MKLNIARNLKKYRKERDITQEALAKDLGISPQSVSKWERGEGYPDIELLPNLANHLNITIDELLGNDSAARKEDIRQFWQKFWSADGRCEGENYWDCRIRIAEEYWRKYPSEYSIANALLQEICGYRSKLEEHRTLMNEAAEKILNDCTEPQYRETALFHICCACRQDEYEKWSGMCASDYRYCQSEILEQRLLAQEENGKALLRRSLNNLKHIAFLLAKPIPNHLSPEQAASKGKKNRRILAMLSGEDGTPPEAWLPCRAYCDFCLFGGIFTRKKITGGTVFLPDEERTHADDVSWFTLRRHGKHSLRIPAALPDAGWEWNCGIARECFEDVIKEARFLGLIERAKAVCPAD